MKKLLALLFLTLGILGSISGNANAVSPLTVADIYNPAKVLRIDLNLPQTSVDSLNNQQTLKVYVPGSITMSLGTKTSGAMDVHVKLKGSWSL